MNNLSLKQKRLIIIGVGLFYILSGFGQKYFPDFFAVHKQTINYLNFILGIVAISLFFSIKRTRMQDEQENNETEEDEKEIENTQEKENSKDIEIEKDEDENKPGV